MQKSKVKSQSRARTFLLYLLMVVPPALADVEAGRDAANKGDFETALSEWRPLAEAGDPEAEYLLGRLYANGDGVPRNFKQAFRWFEKAGRQGHKKAQQAVSKMYQYGDGVSVDKALSEQWKKGIIPAAPREGTNDGTNKGSNGDSFELPRSTPRPSATPSIEATPKETPPTPATPIRTAYPAPSFSTPTATPQSLPTAVQTHEDVPSAFPEETPKGETPRLNSADYERPTPGNDGMGNDGMRNESALPVATPKPSRSPAPTLSPAKSSSEATLDEVL